MSRIQFIGVCIGGFLGAILRYKVGEWIGTSKGFPISTLVINLLGCFILGWFLTFVSYKKIHPSLKVGIGTGLLGSFTTFSTFCLENLKIIQNQGLYVSLAYMILSIGIGLTVAFVGYGLARHKEREGEK